MRDPVRMNIKTPATVRGDPADNLQLESILETAAALGISRRAVYELIASGELKTVHIGRRHLIPKGERLKFVRRRLIESKGDAVNG